MEEIQQNLTEHLNYLSKETDKDGKIYKETIETLYKLHKYIFDKPICNKCVKIDCIEDYQVYRVWRFESIRLFLYNLGWRQEKNILVLRNHDNLKVAIDVLETLFEPENDLNNNVKKSRSVEDCLPANLNWEDDRTSQGFVSEVDSDLEDWEEWDNNFSCTDTSQNSNTEPHPIVTFESDTELVYGGEYRRQPNLISVSSGSDIEISISPSRSNSNEYKPCEHEQQRQKKRKQVFNPFLSAACFMQSALAAIMPLAGSDIVKPITMMQFIRNSTKEILNGSIEQNTSTIPILGKLSAIKISAGPGKSVNISSPHFFGSVAINIKSCCNKTIFNLITDAGPIAAGISLMSAPDGSIVYSKNTSPSSSIQKYG